MENGPFIDYDNDLHIQILTFLWQTVGLPENNGYTVYGIQYTCSGLS